MSERKDNVAIDTTDFIKSPEFFSARSFNNNSATSSKYTSPLSSVNNSTTSSKYASANTAYSDFNTPISTSSTSSPNYNANASSLSNTKSNVRNSISPNSNTTFHTPSKNSTSPKSNNNAEVYTNAKSSISSQASSVRISGSFRFKRRDLFGKTFAAHKKHAHGHVVNMIMEKKIDNAGFVSSGTLSELWSYVYLLVLYNKDHEVFKNFRAQRGALKTKATAKRFYKQMQIYSGHSTIKEGDLIKFINDMVKNKAPANPIVDIMQRVNSRVNGRSNNEIEGRANNEVKSTVAKPNKEFQKLQEFRTMVMKELGMSSDNVQDVINVLRTILQEKNNKKTISSLSLSEACKKDISLFEDEARILLEGMILSKMCIMKYISDIVMIRDKVKLQCNRSPKDLTVQSRNYGLLSMSDKKRILNLYTTNRKQLLDIKTELEKMQSSVGCDTVSVYKTRLSDFREKLEASTRELINIYEDLNGSVRVYVRLRGVVPEIDDKSAVNKLEWTFDRNKDITLNCDGKQTSGSFYGIFDQKYNNLGLFTGQQKSSTEGKNSLIVKNINDSKPWGLYNSFRQLESGYSIVMLGYGQSGSGKTYNLIGNKTDPGVVLYGLANLNKDITVEIAYIFELYYNFISFTNTTLTGQIILGYDPMKNFVKNIAQFGIKSDDISNEPFSIPYPKMTDEIGISEFINGNITAIQSHQREKGRIKSTPNNDRSSRSHLFVVFKVGNGYFTLVDMAGQENVESIYKQIFSSKYTLTFLLMQFNSNGLYIGPGPKDIVSDYIRPEYIVRKTDVLMKKNDVNKFEVQTTMKNLIEPSVTANVQVLFESIYITESLNHLQYFFAKKNGVDKKFKNLTKIAGSIKYKTNEVFVQPSSEDIGMQNNARGRVLMIPVLKFLESLSQGKITKFITIAALRPDKCENIEVLEFAKQISEF